MPKRDVFPPKPKLRLGRYRHFKGGEYEVVVLACDEETHEWLVVYRALYGHGDLPGVWARKYEVFIEEIIVNGKKVKRFEATND